MIHCFLLVQFAVTPLSYLEELYTGLKDGTLFIPMKVASWQKRPKIDFLLKNDPDVAHAFCLLVYGITTALETSTFRAS